MRKRDFYGERGCCLTCSEIDKERMRGVQRDVWYNGKHYDCLCSECKCRWCIWYWQGRCLRIREEVITC